MLLHLCPTGRGGNTVVYCYIVILFYHFMHLVPYKTLLPASISSIHCWHNSGNKSWVEFRISVLQFDFLAKSSTVIRCGRNQSIAVIDKSAKAINKVHRDVISGNRTPSRLQSGQNKITALTLVNWGQQYTSEYTSELSLFAETAPQSTEDRRTDTKGDESKSSWTWSQILEDMSLV